MGCEERHPNQCAAVHHSSSLEGEGGIHHILTCGPVFFKNPLFPPTPANSPAKRQPKLVPSDSHRSLAQV